MPFKKKKECSSRKTKSNCIFSYINRNNEELLTILPITSHENVFEVKYVLFTFPFLYWIIPSFLDLVSQSRRIPVDLFWPSAIFLALRIWIPKLSTTYQFKACPILRIPVKLFHITTKYNLLLNTLVWSLVANLFSDSLFNSTPSLFILPYFSANPIKSLLSPVPTSRVIIVPTCKVEVKI